MSSIRLLVDVPAWLVKRLEIVRGDHAPFYVQDYNVRHEALPENELVHEATTLGTVMFKHASRQRSITLRKNVMAKLVCKIMGVIFVAVGLLGFAAPGMMGMHLSGAHNAIHIVSGLIALYFGFRGTYFGAKRFCLIFGVVYGLLGIAGLMAPPGTPAMAGMPADSHLLRLMPGTLEFGTADSIVHVLIGVLFLAGGLVRPRLRDLKMQDMGQAIKDKVGMK